MSHGTIRRVLVAGGGIGGLATALALQRKGFEAVVLERSEQLRDGGAGLHIWTNGVLALDGLGLADEVLRTAPAQSVCHFSTWRGGSLGAWPVGDFTVRYGRPTIAVERSVLHGILLNALQGDAVRLGAHVSGFTQDRAGVTVRLADGSTERGDILVGADGMHSRVRSGLLGDEAPRYTGYIAWRGRARTEHPLVPPPAPSTRSSDAAPGSPTTTWPPAPCTG